MNKKISVVINTYNAEKDLARVLESVKEFDEIVICDMESTDSTLEIAKQYNCKIVTFPKKNYTIVEPARQFAIDSASYKWVLLVDADEIVTKELHDYLYNAIEKSNCPVISVVASSTEKNVSVASFFVSFNITYFSLSVFLIILV